MGMGVTNPASRKRAAKQGKEPEVDITETSVSAQDPERKSKQFGKFLALYERVSNGREG